MRKTQFVLCRGQMLTFARLIHATDTQTFVALAREYSAAWPDTDTAQTQGEAEATYEMAKALHEFRKKTEHLLPKLNGVV